MCKHPVDFSDFVKRVREEHTYLFFLLHQVLTSDGKLLIMISYDENDELMINY